MFFYLQTMHFDGPASLAPNARRRGPSPSQPTTIPLPCSKCETEGAVSFKPTSVHFRHSKHKTEGLFPKPPPSPSLTFRVRRRGSSPSHNPPPSLARKARQRGVSSTEPTTIPLSQLKHKTEGPSPLHPPPSPSLAF